MNKEQEELFEQKLNEELEKAKIQGMAIGCKSVSKVIYDKINNISRNFTKNDLIRIIKDVQKFCEVGLNIKMDSIVDEKLMIEIQENEN